MDPITTVSVTPELLSAIAGVLIALAFSYIPGLNTKWASLPAELQRLIMAGLMLIVSAVIFLLGCLNFVSIPDFVCTARSAVQFIWTFLLAVMANQSSYKLMPQTPAVLRARSARV